MDVRQDQQNDRFTTPVDGRLAWVEYEETDAGTWNLKHTWVPEEYRNRGIASDLVREVLERARKQDRSVIPTCPFVSSYIEDHPSFEALVEEGEGAAD